MTEQESRQYALAAIVVVSGGVLLIAHGLLTGETTEVVIGGGIVAVAGGLIAQAGARGED